MPRRFDRALPITRRSSTVLAATLAITMLAAAGTVALPDRTVATAVRLSASEMTLVGAEDFNGTAYTAPNPLYWTYDLGGGGWGNNELQTYTNSSANVRLNGLGQMVIEARKSGTSYTSARVVTRGKVDFYYGLLEARIKFPEGQGLHPAVWMLGSNITSVGWPACGEIDTMELVNTGTVYHNAIHGPTAANSAIPWKQSADGAAGLDLASDYHVYQVYRQPGSMMIGIDGHVVGQYSKATMPAGAQWVFDGPMYLTMNIAVGGEWPGPVSSSTVFPATMLVDWIRFWQ